MGKLKILFLLIIATALIAVGCQKIGKWQNLKEGKNDISADKGFDFLISYPSSEKQEYYNKSDIASATATINTSGPKDNGTDPSTLNLNPMLQDNFNANLIELTKKDFNTKLRSLDNTILHENFQNDGLFSLKMKNIAPKTYVVGQNYDFYDTYKNDGTKFTVTCVADSDHAYYFAPGAIVVPDDYKNKFEKIYQTVISKFGPEGDVDQNGKVLIIFYPIADNNNNVLGYFYSPDKLSTEDASKLNCGSESQPKPCETNETDAFYINSKYVAKPESVLETVSHEFQHMTFFNNKISKNLPDADDTWLNEGLSMLSSLYCGYADATSNSYKWIASYLKDTTDNTQGKDPQPFYSHLSLTNWTSSNYGLSALYTYYLNDVYGDNIAKRIYNNYTTAASSGIKAVENATKTDFNEVFNNFAQALYLSNTGIMDDSKFNFKSINLQSFKGGNRNGLIYSLISKPNMEITAPTLSYSVNMFKVDGKIDNITVKLDNKDLRVYGKPL